MILDEARDTAALRAWHTRGSALPVQGFTSDSLRHFRAAQGIFGNTEVIGFGRRPHLFHHASALCWVLEKKFHFHIKPAFTSARGRRSQRVPSSVCAIHLLLYRRLTYRVPSAGQFCLFCNISRDRPSSPFRRPSAPNPHPGHIRLSPRQLRFMRYFRSSRGSSDALPPWAITAPSCTPTKLTKEECIG